MSGHGESAAKIAANAAIADVCGYPEG